MRIRALLLAASCSPALGCPQANGLAAGLQDANALDAGTDGGADIDAGPGDAGGPVGEGEGEGECVPLFGLTDLVDDAGVIHYEACGLAGFDNCNDGSCATTDAERQLVELILEVARDRGYGDQIEISGVTGVPPRWANADAVLIADWARASLFVRVDLDQDGQVSRESVEADLPLHVPSSLPSIDDVLGRIRECSPDAIAKLCGLVVEGVGSCPPWGGVLEGYGGFETPQCTGATLRLWDPCNLDAGPSEVTCYPNPVPCCE